MGICTHDLEMNCVFDQINCVITPIPYTHLICSSDLACGLQASYRIC